jgi:hypothetical protein
VTAWPCSECGAPGIRNLGARGYCMAHLTEVWRLIRPEVWLTEGGGHGLPELMRPDHGEGFAELTCSCCGASWVGAAFARCPWCVALLERMRESSAAAVMTPPDPDDLHYEERMRAWAERLARAVDAGVVRRERAVAAWRREVGRARAA